MTSKKTILSIFIIFSVLFNSLAQEKILLSGFVKDSISGEKLVGASIFCINSQQGIVTNNYGFYSLTVPKETLTIKLSHVGYKSQTILVNARQQEVLTLKLSPTIAQIEEVVVKHHQSTLSDLGKINLSVAKLKQVPSFLGETDIIRALATTPGISTGTEGNTGLNIRGGTPDQNLILLDEAPIYNAGHIGGFFSVFNPMAIKSMDVYKSTFPARFGGRLSSVLDISLNDGNEKKIKAEATLGLLNSNICIDGPIKKEKSSFLLAARYSNMKWLQMLSTLGSNDVHYFGFYDINAKVNYQLSPKTQAFVSFFKGSDDFTSISKENNEKSDLKFGWGNTTGTFRLSHIFNPKAFGKVALVYAKYQNEFDYKNEISGKNILEYRNFNTQSHVKDWMLKLRLDLYPTAKFSLKTGIDAIDHNFMPSSMQSSVPINSDSILNIKEQFSAKEIAFYTENIYQFSPKLSANLGFRFTGYVTPKNTFWGAEPRLGLQYQVGKNWDLKFGASSMQQFVHLLSNYGSAISSDLWLPATSKVPPMQSSQFTLGLSKSIAHKGIDFSFETYYKTMSNLIDYPEGKDFLLTGFGKTWENEVEKNGKGKAYGMELYLAKTTGKLTGWVAYTLSRSERQFATINNGIAFPSKYDRTHLFNIVSTYKLNKKWLMNASWTYQTGHATTLPVAALKDKNNETVLVYTERNQQRMPAFHRLDLSFTKKIIRKNGGENNLTWGIFNAYNRANPSALEVKQKNNGTSSSLNIYKHAIFPIIPSISYTWKF
ncbi:MAG: TonB-dependent receptor [Pseudarcicella sp.]|nr:TonB-dependent receptor [Pseudarcicella sp.]